MLYNLLRIARALSFVGVSDLLPLDCELHADMSRPFKTCDTSNQKLDRLRQGSGTYLHPNGGKDLP